MRFCFPQSFFNPAFNRLTLKTFVLLVVILFILIVTNGNPSYLNTS